MQSQPRRSPSSRGITSTDVDRAADALLREGQRPTIEKVRAKVGRGSPNTVNPLLDAWWSRLAGRLDAGPAALHRLPEPVLHAAEGLWLQALEQARKRAAAEQGPGRTSLAKERQEMEVRAHVLAIRESELQGRLDVSQRRTAALEAEVQALTTLLRKEQASRLSAERLLADSRQPATPRTRARSPGRAPKPTAAAAGVAGRAKSHKSTRNTTRKSPAKKSTVVKTGRRRR